MALSALLLIPCPAAAGVIHHISQAEFLPYLQSPFLFESFESYVYGSYTEQSLTLDQNGYRVVISSPRGLYSVNQALSTRWNVDPLVLDFTDSPTPVTAIGGNFWPTDLPGNNVSGTIRAVLSDETLYTFEISSASYGTFLGFTTDGAPFRNLVISAIRGTGSINIWPTVDNLYVGTDPLPVPEPSSFILLVFGVLMLCRCFRFGSSRARQ